MADDNNQGFEFGGQTYASKEEAQAAHMQYIQESQAQLNQLTGRLKAIETAQQQAATPQNQNQQQFVTGKENLGYDHNRFLETMVTKGEPVDAMDMALKHRLGIPLDTKGNILEAVIHQSVAMQREIAELRGQVSNHGRNSQWPEINFQDENQVRTIQNIQKAEGLNPDQIGAAIKLGQSAGVLPTKEQWVQRNMETMQQRLQGAGPEPQQFQQQPYPAFPSNVTPMQQRPMVPPPIGRVGGGQQQMDLSSILEQINQAPNSVEAQKIYDKYITKIKTA